ncbi:hypothetical protein CXB51_013632 [Gossypium anomalum]|uniref:DUF7745 domain-containing protein n=1 Tax=Gossypium anomalum TaxID=47600 RepID=A0A8J6CZM9_9ROSI|nr:hypothetical protein CXB51_013632 [Gossypium anomalum]
MEKGFLDRIEDNAAIRIWSEMKQQEKGDSLTEGYLSKLWDFAHASVTQNDLQELKEIWNGWNDEIKQLFYHNYEDLPYLLEVKVDKCLFRALVQFWNPTYSCFTFGRVDLLPTVEEYMALLRCSRVKVNKVYSRAANVLPFVKRLMNITGMSDIYGLVVFPKALGHVDEGVSDLFVQLDRGVTPVPAILAETFRSLNACRRVGEGRFVGCAQLLLSWFYSHFWRIEKSLQAEDVEWRAPWMIPDKILYRCGNFNYVPLLGIWGAGGYAPLLVLRQYRSRQFTPATKGLAQCEFSYKGVNYKKGIREISNAWKQTRRMKEFAAGPMTTLEYDQW